MPLDDPLVSVIVPAWNCANWITSTLESVYRQTYRNWEIVLVDDGSTDETRSVLAPHMPRIRYYYQENKGTAAARNAGLRRAGGELIAFLDDDDLWQTQKLELQVRALQASPECGLSFTDGEICTAQGECGKSVLSRHLKPWVSQYTALDGQTAKGWLFRELFMMNFVASASSVVVLRRCLDTIGRFDESIRIADDYDLWLRIALRYPVILVLTRLYTWRWRDESQSGAADERGFRLTRASLGVIEKHLPDAPQSIRAAVRSNLAGLYWSCGRVLFERNDLVGARGMFVQHLRHRRTSAWAMIFVVASYLHVKIIHKLRIINRWRRAIAQRRRTSSLER
jgi:glycosyltransferase involved in cell wall biosynthesis